jgi:hypothetical protein
MPLVKSILEAAIKSAFEKQASKQSDGDDPAISVEELAADIATAIDDYIKTATVDSVVTGTSPSGAVTGTATGTIS